MVVSIMEQAAMAASTALAGSTTQDQHVRLDHYPGSIRVTVPTGCSIWHLTVPDEHLELDRVRIHLREIASLRGNECSVLMPWSEYKLARDWLRCVADGYPERGEIEPALRLLRTAFADLVQAAGL